DRHCLEAQTPGFHIGFGNILDSSVVRHVDGFGNRARDERLHRAHHAQVAEVVDRTAATRRLESAVEYRQGLIPQQPGAFDSFVLVDVLNYRLYFFAVIAYAFERSRDGMVDDLHLSAATQPLLLAAHYIPLSSAHLSHP